jgi:aspartate/methionine/tyrosine aminotransferase
MDPIAENLNEVLKDSIIDKALSSYGKRAYFPKGIVSQSQEAARLAHTINATAGVAISGKHHLSHHLFEAFGSVVTVDDMVSYAPTAGDLELRKAWWSEMMRKNPTLDKSDCSLPVVTSGLTHALSVSADLFVDQEDFIIIPSPCWDNYEQIFAVRKGCRILSPSLFDHEKRFSIQSIAKAMEDIDSGKIIVLLNFPNNPTGYTPSESQMYALASLLIQKAEEGRTVVVYIDDAYFGLFHEKEGVYEHSIFSLLCNAHENLLAIKCDAATKESMVWGFRIGFLTYGARGLSKQHYDALVQKTMGAIRSSVSSCSRVSQSLLLSAMRRPEYLAETAKVSQEMAKRYDIVKYEVGKRDGHHILQPYPFNSGYFCTLSCSKDAELLRKYLLEHHGIGTVSIGQHILRIAYSGVDRDRLVDLIDEVYRSAEALWM